MTYHIHWHIQEIEKAYQSNDLSMLINELKQMAYNTSGHDMEIKSLIRLVSDYSKGKYSQEDYRYIWEDDFVNGLKFIVEMNDTPEPNWVGGECDQPITL